jgi:hypothetical protein
MKVEKNGVVAMEMVDYLKQRPYRIWRADKWKCPECGAEVLVGFGNSAAYPGSDGYEFMKNDVEVTFY